MGSYGIRDGEDQSTAANGCVWELRCFDGAGSEVLCFAFLESVLWVLVACSLGLDAWSVFSSLLLSFLVCFVSRIDVLTIVTNGLLDGCA
jgi:hypothetical protein